jgi:hypothetical protein
LERAIGDSIQRVPENKVAAELRAVGEAVSAARARSSARRHTVEMEAGQLAAGGIKRRASGSEQLASAGEIEIAAHPQLDGLAVTTRVETVICVRR